MLTATGRFTNGVVGQLPLACFEEVLAPAVVLVRRDALSTTPLGDALFASKTLEDDADILFGENSLRVRRRMSLTAASADCLRSLLILRLSSGYSTP